MTGIQATAIRMMKQGGGRLNQYLTLSDFFELTLIYSASVRLEIVMVMI